MHMHHYPLSERGVRKGSGLDLKSTFTGNLYPLLYLGIVTTALANYLQTQGQRGVSASTASLIFALDPVWGAFFANLILGEVRMGERSTARGIIQSTLTFALLPPPPSSNRDSESWVFLGRA